LLLCEAYASDWVDPEGILNFEGKVQNVGFGNVENYKQVSVILKSQTGPEYYNTPGASN